MLTSSLPSAWEEPRQFSIPLPFGYRAPVVSMLLACSATHVVVGQMDTKRVHIYSLPTFDENVLELNEDSYLRSLEVRGEILVAEDHYVSGEGAPLYFYDLSTRKSLGVVINRGVRLGPLGISFPRTELVETEENGKLVQEEWPKNPMLIVSGGPFLQIYMPERSFERGTHNVDSQAVQSSTSMVPEMTILLGHAVLCHASVRRTAVTGGTDATLRVWDIITGECRQVLRGHRSSVSFLCLDMLRIYSSSVGSDVRIWDRYSGDCLHLLDWGPFQLPIQGLDTTPSYLAVNGYTGINVVYICDTVSGRLVHQITSSGRGASCLGPIRGIEHTLVTRESAENSYMDWFTIWNAGSGQALMRLPIGRGYGLARFCCQDRFLLALDTQGLDYMLKVWDFGDNTLASSEDDAEVLSKGEEPREDELGETKIGGSTTTDDGRGSKANNFIRRLFQTQAQEGNETRENQDLTDLLVHYSM